MSYTIINQKENKFHKSVFYWLCTGAFMVLVQIMIGGITRLTGSGLSITRWDIIMGALPPMNPEEWSIYFDLYKETPQYIKLNDGMSLSDFKFIFFWEYFHRLWARSIGIVFLLPFIFFLIKSYLDKQVLLRLLAAFGIGALAAGIGWIMVASGLINRPWVNAYKLTLHLSIGIALFVHMLWLSVDYYRRKNPFKLVISLSNNKLSIFLFLIIVQVLLGGLMSGMRASMFFPTWPKFGTEWIPSVLCNIDEWKWSHFTDYDKHLFMPALVQMLHRSLAYIVTFLFFFFFRNSFKVSLVRIAAILLIMQVILGILTLLFSIGHIPVLWGELHQIIGILFLSFILLLKVYGNKGELN